MRVQILDRQSAAAFLDRMSGTTQPDLLRAELCRQELRIARNLRFLTDPKSAFYGVTFWMVRAAEFLIDAEAQKDHLETLLRGMGESLRGAAEVRVLREEGVAP